MRLQGVFGKTEMEVTAAAIIDAAAKAGTWNIWFEVPDKRTPHHVGFTWLLNRAYLYPVGGASFYWCVNQDFLDRTQPVDEASRSVGQLSQYHGIHSPPGEVFPPNRKVEL